MAKDILKLPSVKLKAPGRLGKSTAYTKMLSAVKNFFKKK